MALGCRTPAQSSVVCAETLLDSLSFGMLGVYLKPNGKIFSGETLIIVALVICIIVSSSSFTWGYWLAGYENATDWIIAFGIFWLVSQWRKWKWFSAPAVLISLGLAAFGVWFKFIPGLMFSGAVFGFLAWNLTEFQQTLRSLYPREDARGMTRRHLIRIGFLAAGAVVITLILGIGK
jgi:hypothetical protein